MSDGWLGAIATVLGVVVGWGLTEWTRVLAESQRVRTALAGAAIVCLERLEKIKSAIDRSNHEQRDREKYLLGLDLDRYLHCIAAAKGRTSAHWHAHKSVMPILLENDFNRLGNVIEEFERLTRVTDD